MDELDRHAVALGAPALMHQAGAVRRDDIISFGLRKILDFVRSHLRRHTFVEHGKGSAEAATFVRAGRGTSSNPSIFDRSATGLEKNGTRTSDALA